MNREAVVYSLSRVGTMVRDTHNSIKSLREVSDIEVLINATPPKLKTDQVSALLKLGTTIIPTPNKTDPITLGTRKGRYLEKLATLGRLEVQNLIFLDGDTKIRRDPRVLLNGDFDFSARIAPSNLNTNWNKYAQGFQDQGIPPLPLFNSGVMIFKNGCADLVSQWALMLASEPFPNYNAQDQRDQLGITLAVSMLNLDIKYMTAEDHGYRWLHESHNCTVYHGSRKPMREILRTIRGIYRYVAQ